MKIITFSPSHETMPNRILKSKLFRFRAQDGAAPWEGHDDPTQPIGASDERIAQRKRLYGAHPQTDLLAQLHVHLGLSESRLVCLEDVLKALDTRFLQNQEHPFLVTTQEGFFNNSRVQRFLLLGLAAIVYNQDENHPEHRYVQAESALVKLGRQYEVEQFTSSDQKTLFYARMIYQISQRQQRYRLARGYEDKENLMENEAHLELGDTLYRMAYRYGYRPGPNSRLHLDNSLGSVDHRWVMANLAMGVMQAWETTEE